VGRPKAVFIEVAFCAALSRMHTPKHVVGLVPTIVFDQAQKRVRAMNFARTECERRHPIANFIAVTCRNRMPRERGVAEM
jgi:hypothetical protein